MRFYRGLFCMRAILTHARLPLSEIFPPLAMLIEPKRENSILLYNIYIGGRVKGAIECVSFGNVTYRNSYAQWQILKIQVGWRVGPKNNH